MTRVAPIGAARVRQRAHRHPSAVAVTPRLCPLAPAAMATTVTGGAQTSTSTSTLATRLAHLVTVQAVWLTQKAPGRAVVLPRLVVVEAVTVEAAALSTTGLTTATSSLTQTTAVREGAWRCSPRPAMSAALACWSPVVAPRQPTVQAPATPTTTRAPRRHLWRL